MTGTRRSRTIFAASNSPSKLRRFPKRFLLYTASKTKVSQTPFRITSECSRLLPYMVAAQRSSSGKSRAGSSSPNTVRATSRKRSRSALVTVLAIAKRESIFEITPRYSPIDQTGESLSRNKSRMLFSNFSKGALARLHNIVRSASFWVSHVPTRTSGTRPDATLGSSAQAGVWIAGISES